MMIGDRLKWFHEINLLNSCQLVIVVRIIEAKRPNLCGWFAYLFICNSIDLFECFSFGFFPNSSQLTVPCIWMHETCDTMAGKCNTQENRNIILFAEDVWRRSFDMLLSLITFFFCFQPDNFLASFFPIPIKTNTFTMPFCNIVWNVDQ